VFLGILGFHLGEQLRGGSSSNANYTITDDQAWTTCRSATINISDIGSHGCVVSASADVELPVDLAVRNKKNTYRIVRTRNDSQIAAHSDQIGEHVSIPVAHYQEDAPA
jgi:ABC-type taurine transport system substrate-binding protein